MHPDGLLYENGKIRITRNIFSNGQGSQFMIAGIKGIRDEHKGKPVAVLILAVILLGLSSVVALPVPYGQYALAGLGGVLMLWYATSKESWRIYLTVAQGEVEAFRTRDETEFRDISKTLKTAIMTAQAAG